MADLRLRAGYTVTPELLLFGTFGGAWANAELPIAGPGGGFRDADFFGWSVGGGAEVALTPELACALRLPVHRFRFRDGELSGRARDFRFRREHLSRIADLPVLIALPPMVS